MKYVYKPILHGAGCCGDAKQIALRIDKLRVLSFKSKADSRKAIKKTVKEPSKEIGFHKK